jgi:hypothetical protein
VLSANCLKRTQLLGGLAYALVTLPLTPAVHHKPGRDRTTDQGHQGKRQIGEKNLPDKPPTQTCEAQVSRLGNDKIAEKLHYVGSQ